MVSSILKVRQWLQRQPPFDLVIDQHHGIPWFAPWWCKTRCVAYIHEVLGPIWSSFYPAPLALLGQFQENLTHRLYRNIPFWTACSETASMLHERGVVQIKQIPYGVHTEVLSSLPEKTIDEPLRLVTVSRLARNKRIEDAIDTVACLKELGLQASLTIIGSGAEASKLKSRIRQLPCASDIRLAGALSESEKDMALTQAHCLLHTSVEKVGAECHRGQCHGNACGRVSRPRVDRITHSMAQLVESARRKPEGTSRGDSSFCPTSGGLPTMQSVGLETGQGNFIGTASCPRHAIGWSRWHSGKAIGHEALSDHLRVSPLTDLSILSDK